MKQLFLGLIALNLCYLLYQQVSTAGAYSPIDPLEPKSEPKTATASLDPFEVGLVKPTLAKAGQAPLIAPPDVSVQTPTNTSKAAPKTIKTSSAQPAVKPVVAVVPSPASCIIAGPFRERQEGLDFVEQLAAADIRADLQPRDAAVLPDYMVYVATRGSVEKARDLQAQFTARKMDSHIIGVGSLKNSLSLGVFSRGPFAQSMRQKLLDEGYEARISEITRNRRGYQVQTDLPPLIRAKLALADTPMIDCPGEIAQR